MKIRFLCVCLVFCALLVCSFMGGRVSATQLQQILPRERAAPYSFPRSWGELKSVISTGRGLTYVFEAPDGNIRVVHAGPVGPEDIEVISR